MSDVTLPAPLVAALSRALDDAYQAGRRDAINALVAAVGNGHAPQAAPRKRMGFGEVWTAEEIALVREMHESGSPPRKIAAAIQERFGVTRTSGAVTRQRSKLGLSGLPEWEAQAALMARRHAERAP